MTSYGDLYGFRQPSFTINYIKKKVTVYGKCTKPKLYLDLLWLSILLPFSLVPFYMILILIPYIYQFFHSSIIIDEYIRALYLVDVSWSLGKSLLFFYLAIFLIFFIHHNLYFFSKNKVPYLKGFLTLEYYIYLIPIITGFYKWHTINITVKNKKKIVFSKLAYTRYNIKLYKGCKAIKVIKYSCKTDNFTFQFKNRVSGYVIFSYFGEKFKKQPILS